MAEYGAIFSFGDKAEMAFLPRFEFDDKILAQVAEISRKLDQLRVEKFPTEGQKT
ncbi:MAG: plasmid partitioning protein RepA, partial [Parvibaculaceae bacterium]